MPDTAATSPRQGGANCYQCRFFAVSWDPRLPYMCRLMGFKSRQLPAIEVLRADGTTCQGFVPKGEGAAPLASTSSPGCSVQLSGLNAQTAAEADLPDLPRLSTFRRYA